MQTRQQLLSTHNFLECNMAEDREKSDVENATAELQKKIADAFDIFDHESNKTVDVRYPTFSVFLLYSCC